MRVGYCRVSTSSDKQAGSIDTQAQRLKDAGCDRVLVDRGVSGFRERGRKHSTFPQLIDLILEGTASEIVVPHFDRTQRRLRWGQQLLDALEVAQIRLLELDTMQWLDPANSPTDVLMAQIRSAVQENESRVRQLKVRKAIQARRQAGQYASGQVPFGYAVVQGKVVPHPENWKLARERFLSLREQQFNVSGWIKGTGSSITPRGVKAWLINPTLRGKVRVKGFPDLECEPLISAAEWRECEALLSARSLRRGVGTKQKVHLFTGLVSCDACGKNMHNVVDSRRRRLKCKARNCERYGQGMRVSVARELVIKALTARYREMALQAADDRPEETPEQIRIKEEIATLEQVSHLPGVPELIAKQQALLLKAQNRRPTRDLRELEALFANPATLAVATDEELRAVVIEYVRSIEWLGGLESLRITLR